MLGGGGRFERKFVVILGIILIIVGLLVASLKVLLWVGIVLLVVGLIVNAVPIGGRRRRVSPAPNGDARWAQVGETVNGWRYYTAGGRASPHRLALERATGKDSIACTPGLKLYTDPFGEPPRWAHHHRGSDPSGRLTHAQANLRGWQEAGIPW